MNRDIAGSLFDALQKHPRMQNFHLDRERAEAVLLPLDLQTNRFQVKIPSTGRNCQSFETGIPYHTLELRRVLINGNMRRGFAPLASLLDRFIGPFSKYSSTALANTLRSETMTSEVLGKKHPMLF